MKNDKLIEELTAGLDSPASEITLEDRLILNNIFDTQPQKRAAYMKQKGFEIDPKDDNRFRPIGSKGSYVGQIDPGMHEAFEKGGVTNLLKEMAKDVGDITFDVGVGGLMTGLAVGKGAAAGAATGAPAGPAGAGVMAILGGLGAGVLSRATTNAGMEALKAGIGEILLDENVPHDFKATAAQSFMAGAAPAVLSGTGKVFNRVAKANVDKVLLGMQSAAKKFNSNLTPEILKEAAERPEMFAPKNLEKIGQKMNAGYANIFGFDPEKAQIAKRVGQVKPNSVIGKALGPLNQAADQEMELLSKTPEGNFKLRDVLDSFQAVKSKFINTGIVTPSEEAALKQIEGYESQVIKMVEKNLRSQGIKGEISRGQLLNGDLDFGQVRTISKKIKDAALDDKVQGAEFLAQIAGSGEGQLGSKLTQKANSLGSSWNEIQTKRHDLLDLHNRSQEVLKPNNLEVAFLGDQTGSGKARVQQILSELDEKAGSNLSAKVKDANAQRAFKQFYENPDVYIDGNPLMARIADTASAATNLQFGDAYKALVKPNAKIRPGENLAELFQKQMQKAQNYNVNYASAPGPKMGTAMGATGIAASKASVPDLQQSEQNTAEEPDQDLVNSLLEGL